MASDVALNNCRPPQGHLPLFRWSALTVLLAAELLALTIRFDGDLVWRQPALWAQLIFWCHHLPYLIVAILTALILFAGRRLWTELRYSAEVISRRARTWPYVLSHLALFALFVRLTALLLESEPGSLPAPGWWAAAWFASASAVVVLWSLCVLPAGVWLRLTRHSLMPLALGIALGSAAWVAGQGAEHLGGLLDGITFELVHRLLTLFRGDAYGLPEEALVGTSTFYVRIAPECSGYQGIGLIGVFLITYLWVCRDSLRFPRALLLLPLGVLVMYLANVGRIAALVAVGTYLSPEVALGGFHSQAGWLIFTGVVLGVVYATR
ncbi:MAG: archaeosortase/exosortase family protein, partial [Gemmataceae bacterium]